MLGVSTTENTNEEVADAWVEPAPVATEVARVGEQGNWFGRMHVEIWKRAATAGCTTYSCCD